MERPGTARVLITFNGGRLLPLDQGAPLPLMERPGLCSSNPCEKEYVAVNDSALSTMQKGLL